jgi:beta-lactamase regulating signal transducer with metallopeptidase domain
MTIAVYVPLAAAVLFAAVGPRLALRGLPPVAGVWTLTVGAALIAIASCWSLALLAATLVDEVLPAGYLQIGVVDEPTLVNDVVAAAAAVALVLGFVRLVRDRRASRAMRRELHDLCADSPSDLVVLADAAPQAFAVPVGSGRVVVSSGMLAALSGPERRVLLAHERAHLRARHHWHADVVRVAIALNPVLAGVREASEYLCERWADEVAAAVVGDRRLTATSLARAALAASGTGCPPAAFGYHGVGVRGRVAALQAPPARPRPTLALALLGLAGIGLAADVEATGDFLRVTFGLLH